MLNPDKWWAKLAIHQVPATYLAVTALGSYLILAVCYLQGVIPWLAFGLALSLWAPIILTEIDWTYKHFGWFALFALAAFVQTIHYSEHCIEMIQYHIFHDPLSQSTAIFTAFNVEWVHFAGDTFLTLSTIVLLMKFPRNPLLWVAIPFQLAHQSEHTFLIFNYLFEGAKPGAPGLLGSLPSGGGGAIHGGLGWTRVDLHWVYNTLYTLPFAGALVYQVKHTYDESLAEAFPDVPSSELLSVSKHLETFHYAPSETVLAPGDDIDRLYIITEGEAAVYRHDETGREVEIATLHKGQYFGEIGLLVPGAPHTKTIRALTKLSVLAMDEETFEHLMQVSHVTADEVLRTAESRVTPQTSGTTR